MSNVAQVRKALNILRTNWENNSPLNPFCLSEKFEDGVTFSEFCFSFIMNHHSKRQTANRNVKMKKPSKVTT